MTKTAHEAYREAVRTLFHTPQPIPADIHERWQAADKRWGVMDGASGPRHAWSDAVEKLWDACLQTVRAAVNELNKRKPDERPPLSESVGCTYWDVAPYTLKSWQGQRGQEPKVSPLPIPVQNAPVLYECGVVVDFLEVMNKHKKTMLKRKGDARRKAYKAGELTHRRVHKDASVSHQIRIPSALAAQSEKMAVIVVGGKVQAIPLTVEAVRGEMERLIDLLKRGEIMAMTLQEALQAPWEDREERAAWQEGYVALLQRDIAAVEDIGRFYATMQDEESEAARPVRKKRRLGDP